MSFFKSLERKVLRPIGRGAKAVAPIAGGVIGTALGGPLGGALGSSLGGALKRGRIDLGKDAMNFGTGLLTAGIGSKLGLGGMGGGAAKSMGAMPSAANMAAKIGITGGSGLAAAAPSIGQQTFQSVVSQMAPEAGRSMLGEAGNWLSQGQNIKALGDAAIGGLGAYQQNQQLGMQRDQMNRNNALEDEERRRRAALDPARAQLMAALFSRLGLQNGMAA